MNTVSAIHTAVNNPSLDDVCKWHLAKADRGEVARVTVKLRITALNCLTSVLGQDEPRDAGWLLKNIDNLGKRWATKTQGNPATAHTYVVRAKGALADFLAWREDPMKFRFKPSIERAKKPNTKKEPEQAAVASPPAEEPEVNDAVVVPPKGPHPVADGMRTFPLGQGREAFPFQLPSDGLTVRDVKRIACHLLTLADDFDPTTPSHAEVFAIVNRRAE